MDSVHMLLQRI